MKKIFACLIVLCMYAGALDAQTTLPQTTAPPAQPQPTPAYEPYAEDEFPEWLHDLRRGEIILFGSFPFTFFFVTEGYDFYRFATHSFDSNYAPWPFRNTALAPYSGTEQAGVVIGAIGLSLVIAVADYLIRKNFNDDEKAPVVQSGLQETPPSSEPVDEPIEDKPPPPVTDQNEEQTANE